MRSLLAIVSLAGAFACAAFLRLLDQQPDRDHHFYWCGQMAAEIADSRPEALRGWGLKEYDRTLAVWNRDCADVEKVVGKP